MSHVDRIDDIDNEIRHGKENPISFVKYRVIVNVQTRRSQGYGSEVVQGVQLPPFRKVFLAFTDGMQPTSRPHGKWNPKRVPVRRNVIVLEPECLQDIDHD
jgi:hypothetical protein